MSFSNNGPIFWSQDYRSIHHFIGGECDEHPSNSLPCLVRTSCLKSDCRCVLRQENALVFKGVRQVAFAEAVWQKSASKVSSSVSLLPQVSDKASHLLLSSDNPTWFEVLNESGKSVPYWTNVHDLVRHKPNSFLFRKDLKCLYATKNADGIFQLNSDNTVIIRVGTVLNYLEFNHFRVTKSRKIKELPLLKCCDTAGRLIFLHLEDKCAISPVAGSDNIFGVHSLMSVLQKFQLPISIRPVFHTLASWLPSSDRHYLRLNRVYQDDIVCLEPLSGLSGRFFVVTPGMLADHYFAVGESESRYHYHLLQQHTTKVKHFLSSCHTHESLQYLLPNMSDVSMQRNSTPKSCCCGERNSQMTDSETAERDNQLFDEIEDIYYYVRTGHYPLSSRSRSLSMSLAALEPPSLKQTQVPNWKMTVHTEHQKLALARSAPDPTNDMIRAFNQQFPDGLSYPQDTQEMNEYPNADHHCSCHQLDDQKTLIEDNGGKAWENRVFAPQNLRTTSCDNLFERKCENDDNNSSTVDDYPPPPPLPPRMYFSTTEIHGSGAPQVISSDLMQHVPRRINQNRRDGYAVVRKTQPITIVR